MTKSLPELESGNANFLAAKANAAAEIKRLQDRRETLLLTASVDEILALDGEIRRQEIAGEIAQAKADALRGDLHWAREEVKRWAGVDLPSDAELEQLLDIVSAAHPNEFRYDLQEFKRAMLAVGRLGRLSEPSNDRYVSSMLDDANEILRARRLQSINGDMLLAAALAWADCVWREADTPMGQQLGLGLAKLNQGAPAVAKWRDVLSGKANLLAPLPPRNARASSSTYPTPRVKITYSDTGKEVDPVAPLWVQ